MSPGERGIELMIRRDESLVAQLTKWESSRPDVVAFTFLPEGEEEGATFTYAELTARAKAIAVALSQRLKPGDRALQRPRVCRSISGLLLRWSRRGALVPAAQ